MQVDDRAQAPGMSTCRTQQCAQIRHPNTLATSFLCRGLVNKSDICAEEYGKASVHTRLHNPEKTGVVVQTTSENDSRCRFSKSTARNVQSLLHGSSVSAGGNPKTRHNGGSSVDVSASWRRSVIARCRTRSRKPIS
jgi:hypothetical protein